MATPTISDVALRLHHGTDEDSANGLVANGVNDSAAAAFNISGEFWATASVSDAETFAQVNPAGGVPALYSFDLPDWVLESLLGSTPPQAYRHSSSGIDWYEFLPDSFPLLNGHMTRRQVSPVL